MLTTADWTLNELKNRNYSDKIRGDGGMKNTEKYIKHVGCRKRSIMQISRIPEENEKVGQNYYLDKTPSYRLRGSMELKHLIIQRKITEKHY